jgi:hypothetical protein
VVISMVTAIWIWFKAATSLLMKTVFKQISGLGTGILHSAKVGWVLKPPQADIKPDIIR